MKTTIAILMILTAIFTTRGTQRYQERVHAATPPAIPSVMMECHQLPPFL